MANSWAASLPTVGANNGGNVTLTFSNFVNAAGSAYTLVQDDVVVAAYACSGTADHAMATSSSGWTKLAEHYSDGTNDTNLAVFAKKMTASPDTSIVFTGPGGTSNATIGVAHAIKGADISALDVAAVLAAGTGTSVPNPGAVTPATAGTWIAVVGAGVAGTGATYGHTDLATTTNHFRTGNHAETIDCAIGFGWKENWVSGAFDPAVWTGGNVNAANSWAAITLAIKEQSAAVTQDLTPSLFTNTQTFHVPTVTASYDLVLALLTNTQSFFAPVVFQPQIVNHANTTVTSLGGDDYRIEKTSGGTAYNADAVSTIGASGDFTLRISVNTGGANFALLGMNSDPLADSDFASVDFGWLVDPTIPTTYIFESGVQIAAGVVAPNDYLWITRTGTSLKYLSGATLGGATTHRTTTSSGTLYFDSSFQAVGQIYDVQFTVDDTLILAPALFTNTQTFHSAGLGLDLKPSLLTNAQSFFTAATNFVLSAGLFSNSQTFYPPQVAPGAATVAPSLFTNSQTFHAPTVARGTVNLSPSQLSNSQTFHAATVSQAGGGTQALTPSLFTNSQSFLAPTVSRGTVSLTTSLFSNAQTFHAPTVTRGVITLTPALFTNAQTFHAAAVTGAAGLAPGLFTNTQTFHAPTVGRGVVGLSASRLDNSNVLYLPVVDSGSTPQTLTPSLFVNLSVHHGSVLTISLGIPPARVAVPTPINRSALVSARVNDPEVATGSRVVRPSRRLP